MKTACLEPPDRARVDEELCGDHEGLEGLGTRRLVALARAWCAPLDPAAVVRRARRAESERCVSLRPAPDTMTYLTALVPLAHGVAAYAALRRDADTAQTMADLLIERLTGQREALAVPIAVQLVVSDATLFGAGTDPAVIDGSPVPAQLARELLASSLDHSTQGWIRRLYAAPDGERVAMSSRQRFVRGGLAEFLRVRDQGLCRTPWCDAPARHGDHVHDAGTGGETTVGNTQGLCAACNHAKQAPGVGAPPVTRARATRRRDHHAHRPPSSWPSTDRAHGGTPGSLHPRPGPRPGADPPPIGIAGRDGGLGSR